ncbi:IS200/IS605 family transposase [Niabella hibiscisoli]|uniref:IS200/IS605 family transposase n=1 Tax=Niabella hibiscisoli TaxID=1825928 RepID=UPI001F10CFDF|nr:IS200/IS605 family transposase [Niabella hibiscisoli]MCH5718585.1 IS200/IS605 family transposase [Niabella hibiscisoli]
MSQSLAQLYVHIIFHTKYNQSLIYPDVENELYAYIGGIIKANQSVPITINGIENHIHILAGMSKNIALSKLVEEIKRNSSRWIKTKGEKYRGFAWQGGYAGYSVSQSVVERVRKYIDRQKEHHKRVSFQDEYLQFLAEYRVDFDENYLWT